MILAAYGELQRFIYTQDSLDREIREMSLDKHIKQKGEYMAGSFTCEKLLAELVC
jgi:hypothetical protein